MALKISQLTPVVAGTLSGTEPVELGIAGDKRCTARDIAMLMSGKGYIDGAKMIWNSAGSLTLSSFSAYVPSLSKNIYADAAITKSGLVLPPSAFSHVYAFQNGASADFEISATAPAAAYNGTARTKTGDASRRYIASVLTDASANIINFWMSGTTISYVANAAAGSAPYRILNGGVAATPTLISAAGIMPVTAFLAQTSCPNTATSGILCFSPGNYTGPAGVLAINPSTKVNSLLATDANQAFTYQYTSPPSGGAAYMDILGYIFER